MPFPGITLSSPLVLALGVSYIPKLWIWILREYYTMGKAYANREYLSIIKKKTKSGNISDRYEYGVSNPIIKNPGFVIISTGFE